MIKHRPNKAGPVPESCPLKEALRFLAGAWTPEILWYLREEPRRFGDLRRDLKTISSKVLTTRLRELERQGVINRKVMPTSPPTVEYSLTELGRRFEPVLHAIAEVGQDLKAIGDCKKSADDAALLVRAAASNGALASPLSANR